jgi:hypothetical protein
MPATGSSKIDEIANEIKGQDVDATSSGAATLIFVPVAITTASSFSYLFSTQMFDMPLANNLPIFGIVTIATVALLMISYDRVAKSRFVSKAKEYNVTIGASAKLNNLKSTSVQQKKKAAAEAAFEAKVFSQCTAFSLWKNNFIFFTLALFLGFVLFKPLIADFPQVNYTLTMLIPSGFILWLSSFSQ